MSFMEELTGDWLAQAQFVLLAKLLHATNCFPTRLQTEAPVLGKTGDSDREQLLDVAELTGSEALANESFQLRLFDLNGHTFTLREMTKVCNTGNNLNIAGPNFGKRELQNRLPM
jgi:hypothetical protein